MIKKATANEWNQVAQTPGTVLIHRKRGRIYHFTVIDAATGEVVGLAMCDEHSGREDFLVEQRPEINCAAATNLALPAQQLLRLLGWR